MLGMAAAATVAVALQQGVATSRVSPFDVQWRLVHPPLSAAIVYFENAMANTQSFAAEQLLGVLGVPKYNINNVWAPPLTNHTEAIRILRAVAVRRGHGTRPNATLPIQPGSENLTVTQLVQALTALGPVRGDQYVQVAAGVDPTAPILWRDLRRVLYLYLADGRPSAWQRAHPTDGTGSEGPPQPSYEHEDDDRLARRVRLPYAVPTDPNPNSPNLNPNPNLRPHVVPM